MVNETKEEIEETMRAYPHKLNKYIHREARAKLAEINKTKKDIEFIDEDHVNIEDTDKYKELKKRTVKDLKIIAKMNGISKYYDMNEDELIKSILSVK